MKLILFACLTWMIPNTAETLQCFQGIDEFQYLHSCSFADNLCATATVSGVTQGSPRNEVFRSCLPPSICAAHGQTFSYRMGDVSLTASIHCCNTDGCNNQNFSYPDPGEGNGLSCLRCTGPTPAESVCNSTVECLGIQNRCINVNVNEKGRDVPHVGCVSSNVCELASQPKVQQDLAARYNIIVTPRVEGSSFCSSSWSLHPSVAPLLLGVIALVVFQNQR